MTASVNHVTVHRDGKTLCEVALAYEASDVSLSPSGAEVAVGGNDKKVHVYTLSNDTLTGTRGGWRCCDACPCCVALCVYGRGVILRLVGWVGVFVQVCICGCLIGCVFVCVWMTASGQ